MKKILMIMAVLIMLCPDIYASGKKAEESPAVQLLTSSKNTRKLEGGMLKMARPVLKKTPMAAIMDDIGMMIICPLGKEKGNMAAKAESLLKDYTMVKEINDELSHMYIYIDTPVNDSFSELILYITSPEANIMLFEGNFTVEGLMKVGELAVLDRKQRIRAGDQ